VSAVPGTSDLWAVNSDGGGFYYWDGHTWKQVASPNPAPSGGTYAQAVSAAASSDVWAAGYYERTTSSGGCQGFCSLAEQRTGQTWKITPTPSP
jgi:hypothetical protein